jgi:hypothetical protein
MHGIFRRRTAAGMAGALLALSPGFARAGLWTLDEQNASYLFQLFSDADDIQVYSNYGNYAFQHVNGADFSLNLNHQVIVVPAIEAPIGSQEAVDAITTASRPIRSTADAYEDYSKLRDEIRTTFTHKGVSGTYYTSFETDYFAQLAGLNYDRNFFDQNFNLSVGASYGWDDIEPLADQDTQGIAGYRNTTHMNVVATQILSRSTIGRIGYEMNFVDGLQHSPYRNVWVDGSNVAERHPNERARHDVFLRVHQYLPNRSALKADYKYYVDDWGIVSHTVGARLNQYVTERVTIRYRYRYYTQGAADFYREEYLAPGGVDGYQTGDYRMGDFDAHLFGTQLDWSLGMFVSPGHFLSRARVSLNYERYFNSNQFSANIFESGISFAF